jgi:hypothetical protein
MIMKIKTITIIISSILAMSSGLRAQQESPVNTGLGFGFQLVEYQNDFGLGMSINSPYFLHNSIGLRLKANVMYNQHLTEGNAQWTPYSNISLGVIGVGGYVSDRIRLYGEGGTICLLPSSSFSSEKAVFNGYGLFGFEFFFAPIGNYFIEIGGIGGAVADKADTKPIYSTGMMISTGVRFFMK